MTGAPSTQKLLLGKIETLSYSSEQQAILIGPAKVMSLVLHCPLLNEPQTFIQTNRLLIR